MIAIRTNASSSTGVGHLARSLRLASALKERFGRDAVFFLDRPHAALAEWLDSFPSEFLYGPDEAFVSQEDDTRRLLARLKSHRPELVVFDDYRIFEPGETLVAESGLPVVALDDRGTQPHRCSILVDAKWAGRATKERYSGLVPESCLRLLGPRYALLDAAIAAARPPRAEDGGIVVGIGGGGDMAMLRAFLLELAAAAPSGQEWTLRPVVGPFASDKDAVLSLARENPRMKPILGAKSLLEHLRSASLYVGAAGGTLYEALALSVPALTFSIAPNQANRISDLEDLGHYWHLDELNEGSFSRAAKLVWLMFNGRQRIGRLGARPRVLLDGQGVLRVAEAIDALLRGEGAAARFSGEDAARAAAPQDPGEGYRVEVVGDDHVNRYLETRNLAANRENMLGSACITRLDHYIWWLTTSRVSYLLSKSGLPLLYFWHQVRDADGRRVLIGGWHVCSHSCGPLDVLYALDYQLRTADRELPGVPWVAVIKNSNRFVQSLNRRCGFKRLEQESGLARAAEQCFPTADRGEFSFFWRPSAAAASGVRDE